MSPRATFERGKARTHAAEANPLGVVLRLPKRVLETLLVDCALFLSDLVDREVNGLFEQDPVPQRGLARSRTAITAKDTPLAQCCWNERLGHSSSTMLRAHRNRIVFHWIVLHYFCKTRGRPRVVRPVALENCARLR